MPVIDPDGDIDEVLEGTVNSQVELKLVEKGTKPAAFEEDIQTVVDKSAAPGSTTWNFKDILLSKSVY